MLSVTHYAQNYAGKIDWSLRDTYNCLAILIYAYNLQISSFCLNTDVNIYNKL